MRQFDYISEMMALALQDTPTLRIKGRVTQVIGTIIKAVVPSVKVGEVCILRNPGENFEMKGEVVGFARDAALLTPIGDMYGISTATEVIPTGRAHMVPVGPGLLGRCWTGWAGRWTRPSWGRWRPASSTPCSPRRRTRSSAASSRSRWSWACARWTAC